MNVGLAGDGADELNGHRGEGVGGGHEDGGDVLGGFGVLEGACAALEAGGVDADRGKAGGGG